MGKGHALVFQAASTRQRLDAPLWLHIVGQCSHLDVYDGFGEKNSWLDPH